MSAYRFPPIAIKPKSFAEQIDKLYEEVGEVWDAYIDHTSCKAIGMELMDVIQAAETALRMLPFNDEGIEELRAETIAKNAARGYFEAVDR